MAGGVTYGESGCSHLDERECHLSGSKRLDGPFAQLELSASCVYTADATLLTL